MHEIIPSADKEAGLDRPLTKERVARRVGLEEAAEEEPGMSEPVSIKQSKATSGLTLGLLLKNYNEFIGITELLVNIVFLTLLVNMIIQQNYNSVQSTTFKNSINTALAYGPPANPASLYTQTGIVDASLFICNQMQAIFTDSVTNNLRPDTNQIALGSTALFTSLSYGFNLDRKYMSCTSSDCTALRAVLSDASSPLYKQIKCQSSMQAPYGVAWESFDSCDFVVFDSRDVTQSTSNSHAALKYFCSTVIPTIAPFSSQKIGELQDAGHFVLTFQDLYEPLNKALVEIIFVEFPKTSIFVGGIVSASWVVWMGTYSLFDDPFPYRNASGRLTLEILVFLFALVISSWEVTDFNLSSMQSKSSKKYWTSSFNHLDILSLSLTLILVLVKWVVYVPLPRSDGAFASGDDAFLVLARCTNTVFWSYGLCVCLFINTIRATKFLRYHAALRTYMRFFLHFFDMISGFIIVRETGHIYNLSANKPMLTKSTRTHRSSLTRSERLRLSFGVRLPLEEPMAYFRISTSL